MKPNAPRPKSAPSQSSSRTTSAAPGRKTKTLTKAVSGNPKARNAKPSNPKPSNPKPSNPKPSNPKSGNTTSGNTKPTPTGKTNATGKVTGAGQKTPAGRPARQVVPMAIDNVDQLSENIGRAIRNRRTELGITMAELAATADLSQPFLSKVERGIGRMSMGALDRVARALGTSAVGLFAGSDAPVTIDVVRRNERPKLPAYDHDEGMGQALTRRSGQLRVVEFDSGPAKFAAVPYVHRNDSVCVVLSGEYEFEFDETTRFTLGEGDSVSSSGGVNQRYRVLRQPARLLLILVSEDVDVVPRHSTTSPTL